MTIDKVGNVNNVFDAKRTKSVQKNGQLPQGNDSVAISTEGLKAIDDARITQMVRETPDTRADRVEQIKAQMLSGAYDKDIDNKILDLVADKILTQILRK